MGAPELNQSTIIVSFVFGPVYIGNKIQKSFQVLERSTDIFEGFYSFTQRVVYRCHLPNFVTVIRRETVFELSIFRRYELARPVLTLKTNGRFLPKFIADKKFNLTIWLSDQMKF